MTPLDTTAEAHRIQVEWSREGNSERQFGDAVGVAEVQGDELGWDYLENWAKELNIAELYERLLSEIGRD